MKMPIAKQREVIYSLNWARNYLTGGTREENARCDLPTQLAPYIAAVEALEIPARFARDIESRANALEGAQKTLARWQENRNLVFGVSQ